MSKILICIILFTIFLNCNKNDKIELSKKRHYDEISDLFIIQDSCDLEYPPEAFPARVNDIALTDSFIYTAGMTREYPLVKFRKNGKFVKFISRQGLGPGEIHSSMFQKIAAYDSFLAVGDVQANRLIMFKNDEYYLEKNFLDNLEENLAAKITDLEFLDSKYIIASCYGNAEYHLLVLKIEGKNLKIEQRLYKLPKQANLINLGGWIFYHGLEKYADNSFISNFAYPSYIVESTFKNGELKIKKVYKNLKLKKFLQLDSTITIQNLVNKKADLISVSQTFSAFNWMTKINDFIIGEYVYYTDEYINTGKTNTKKRFYSLFVMKEGKIIHERKIGKKVVAHIFSDQDQLIYYSFPFSDREIVRLYFLTINEKNSTFAP